MSVVAGIGQAVELRHRRHALRAERARVLHWRRLVQARLDLAVAAVAGPAPLGEELALILPDIHPEIPAAAELRRAVRGHLPVAEVQLLETLRELDRRLGHYEEWVEVSLREATDQLVEHLTREPLAAVTGPDTPRG